MTPVTKFLRQATRKDGDPLNILTICTHEAYETGLAKTGHNFYGLELADGKKWVSTYRKPPSNYHLIKTDKENIQNNLPMYVDFDLVLAQNVFGGFQTLFPFAKLLNLPLVRLEHTLPHPGWHPKKTQSILSMRGHANVYISEFSMGKWGDAPDNNATVIHHCVDTDLFKDDKEDGLDYCLLVVNDYINRSWCCGYDVWEEIKKHTSVDFRILGDTKGLSEPAKSLNHLVEEYAKAPIFLNTSTVSPVPTALLEAMSSGCAVVTTGTCMIPEIIQNGFNGFMSNDPKELAGYIEILRKDENLRKQMGQAARATILQKFGEERFINEWNNLFYEVVNI